MLNINELLREKRLTKVELARRMGISREYLYSLLRNPAADTAGRIAAALEVETARVAGYAGGATAQRTIHILPFDEWRFVRQIHLVVPWGTNRMIDAGYILYERPVGKTYKMRERRSDESEFDYQLTLRSKLSDYPSDYLDEIILEGIRRDFPESRVNVLEVYADSELSTIDSLQQQPRKPFCLQMNLSAGPDRLIADANRGIQHYWFRPEVSFYMTAPACMSEHVAGATALFDLEHEQEILETFDRKAIRFL